MKVKRRNQRENKEREGILQLCSCHTATFAKPKVLVLRMSFDPGIFFNEDPFFSYIDELSIVHTCKMSCQQGAALERFQTLAGIMF